MNADRNQQEQLQEKNEASTQQLEQQQRQSPGSVSQQQVTNKVGAGFATREHSTGPRDTSHMRL